MATGRRIAAGLFIDRRRASELVLVLLCLGAFYIATRQSNFAATLSVDRRGSLYTSLATSVGALLGFVLAALSVLVALPSTERLEALRQHPRFADARGSFFRAGRALLATLVLTTLGIALDSGDHPWRFYEWIAVTTASFSLVRILGVLVALDQIVQVAAQRTDESRGVTDPGL